VFVDDRTRIDQADVADFAQMVGLDRFKFRKALADPSLEAERLVIAEKAKSEGVFGVPFFIVGKRSFFGNDRLALLHHYLVTMPVDGGATHWA
jgi:2-hydroxychromene-2-carboxylate isomerase